MNNLYKYIGRPGIAVAIVCSLIGCTRDIDTETLAPYPGLSDVFIDGFASDLEYQAWGKSTNFDVDKDTKYEGTSAIKIEVPGPNDPLGNWAGGNFYSKMGRNLTQYDALTFYAKASIPASMTAGFGTFGENTDYQVSDTVKLNTAWEKFIVPIPNAARLLAEQGLFYYSAGMVNNQGYTIWIDNVKYEHLGTLAHPTLQGDKMIGFPGSIRLGNLTETINLPNGINAKLNVSPKYFTFESSDPKIAEAQGDSIQVHRAGEVTLTAKEAEGQITLHCYDYAPVPTRLAADVMSLYSDAYLPAITANWNPHWQYSNLTYSEINTGKEHVGQYTSPKAEDFEGIVFSQDADCSGMDFMHVDVLSADAVNAGAEFKIEIHNRSGQVKAYTITAETAPALRQGAWSSLEIPLDELGGDRKIFQLAISFKGISHILLDNIYFYK